MKTAAETRLAAQGLRDDRATRVEEEAMQQLKALDLSIDEHLRKHSADPSIVKGAVSNYTGHLNERALARLSELGYWVEDVGDRVAAVWSVRWPA